MTTAHPTWSSGSRPTSSSATPRESAVCVRRRRRRRRKLGFCCRRCLFSCQDAEAFELSSSGFANGVFVKFLKKRLLDDEKITVVLDRVAEGEEGRADVLRVERRRLTRAPLCSDMGQFDATKGKQALEIRSSLSERRALADPIVPSHDADHAHSRQWAKAHGESFVISAAGGPCLLCCGSFRCEGLLVSVLTLSEHSHTHTQLLLEATVRNTQQLVTNSSSFGSKAFARFCCISTYSSYSNRFKGQIEELFLVVPHHPS